MSPKMLFDEWPERYDQWFQTPIGSLVKETETELINRMLNARPGESILDAGCGTGVFTLDFLAEGASIVGLDISRPMLQMANKKTGGYLFSSVQADILHLPFKNNSFDKAVSITALEFITDAKNAIKELFRVTRPGGLVLVATLNSLSPWAIRRKAKTQEHVLENAFFRSPEELLACSPLQGISRTVVHFLKDDDPDRARIIEKAGQSQGLTTGAFVAVRWQKP